MLFFFHPSTQLSRRAESRLSSTALPQSGPHCKMNPITCLHTQLKVLNHALTNSSGASPCSNFRVPNRKGTQSPDTGRAPAPATESRGPTQRAPGERRATTQRAPGPDTESERVLGRALREHHAGSDTETAGP